jgi:hypothetical protein
MHQVARFQSDMYKESQPSELSRFETIQLADFDAPFLMKQFSNIH